MKYLILLVSTLLFVTGCSSSKGEKAVAKLHAFSGNWAGKGKIYTHAGDTGTLWNSRVNYRGAYDDILVERKEVILTDSGETIATLSFLGWDWDAGNRILLSVANDGKGAKKEVLTQVNSNKFEVVSLTTNGNGQSVQETAVTELMGDSYKITKTISVDGATPYTSFEGHYQRQLTEQAVDLSSVATQVPLSTSTQRIACMAGRYKQKGHFLNHPIDGDENIELILGGHAMLINFKFKQETGGGYFGSSITSWNSAKDRFTGFMLSNDGMAAPFEAWLSEDKSKLIYEPLNDKGQGIKGERWYADLNQQPDHCLEQVLVDDNNDSRYGLYLQFTKVAAFEPPKNLNIKRTYAMKASGVKIGRMESVREADYSKGIPLIKDVANSLVGFADSYDTKAQETFWFNAGGLTEYKGKFT